jgi:hypothetical protein
MGSTGRYEREDTFIAPLNPDYEVPPVLDTSYYALSAAQVAMANLIVEEFLAAGFGYPAAAAAVVNAFRESSFEAGKTSPSGKFIGLFQIGPDILASVEDRKDPRKNTRAIISEAKKASAFMAVAATSSHIPTLAGEFAYYVERPKDKAGEKALRYTMATHLYPDGYWQNSEDALTPRAPYVPSTAFDIDDPANKHIVQLAVLGVVVGALTYFRYRENLRKMLRPKGP